VAAENGVTDPKTAAAPAAMPTIAPVESFLSSPVPVSPGNAVPGNGEVNVAGSSAATVLRASSVC